jgi:hypothetical protein
LQLTIAFACHSDETNYSARGIAPADPSFVSGEFNETAIRLFLRSACRNGHWPCAVFRAATRKRHAGGLRRNARTDTGNTTRAGGNARCNARSCTNRCASYSRSSTSRRAGLAARFTADRPA